jgi:hypothetical protein
MDFGADKAVGDASDNDGAMLDDRPAPTLVSPCRGRKLSQLHTETKAICEPGRFVIGEGFTSHSHHPNALLIRYNLCQTTADVERIACDIAVF